MKPTFQRRLLGILTIAFACTAVAGTLLHECGHYLVARLFGYQAKISYAYTDWDKPSYNKYMDSVFEKHGLAIRNQLPYPGQDAVERVQSNFMKAYCWITIAGPLQTLFTGCAGLILVLIYRRRYVSSTSLSFPCWLFLFLSLFWSRQVFNFIGWCGQYARTGYPSYRMDEVKIAQYLYWPIWSITAVTGIIGLSVSIYINFKIVPVNLRFTFLLAGLLGGLGGFLLWIHVVGPALLPR